VRIAQVAALAVTLGLASQAVAKPERIYEGSEAAALRCANTLALTAVTLGRAELMGTAEKDVMLGITILILERHVGGTWRQKKAALEVMRDRRDLRTTLEDYRKNAARCLRQFPIN
tara:strand:- start:107 stop:454 length:348 start_codon:yes stop_codon:yes gene_type:complete